MIKEINFCLEIILTSQEDQVGFKKNINSLNYDVIFSWITQSTFETTTQGLKDNIYQDALAKISVIYFGNILKCKFCQNK